MTSSLKANVAYNFVYQVLIFLLPLITAPYLSRVIGAEGLGAYAYSFAIATYYVYFVKLGLDNYGNRCIAACQDNRRERTCQFWSIFMMQAVCFVVSFLAYIGYVALFAENKTAAALQGLYLFSALLDINWFFFGMELFKLTVLRNAIIKSVTAALVFLLIKSPEDIDLYIGLMSGSFLVSQIALWPFLPSHIGLYRPRFGEIVRHIRPNLILFVSVLAISVYNTLSRVILGYMEGASAVGFFDCAAKIVSVPTALIGAIGTVMLPRASALLARGGTSAAETYIERTMIAVLAFSGLSSFGIASIAMPFTLFFYGEGFEQTAYTLVVLSATIPLLGYGNVMRTQYLLPNQLDSVFLVSAICGAIASISVNIALIPSIGVIGSAFASVAAELSVLLFQLVKIRGSFPVLRYIIMSIAYLLCGAVMALVLSFLPNYDSYVLDCGIRIGLGILVYSCLAVPISISFIRKRKDKKNK